MKTWEEFRKYTNHTRGAHPDNFYGCLALDDDGKSSWFDSSSSFEIAVHWCCYASGQFNLSDEEEIKWMTENGPRLGLSIVHGEQIKRMYAAGLIK